ncbi:MAG: DUF2497 domain-containing protein [Rhodovarius sp.]|nr:DUF2497 domain-containing protein [Rhodovarius sp.]
MSATQAIDRGGRAEAPAATDPSMDDILASIRRILNEDELTPAAGAGPAAPTPGPEEPLQLTEAMMVADAPPAAVAPPTPGVAPALAAAPAAPAAAAPPGLSPAASAAPPHLPAEAPAPSDPSGREGTESLLAPAAAAAAAASIGALLRAVAADRGAMVARGGGPTLEDLVREELRPLLKAWLDRHLPALVEQAVAAEIARLSARAA